MHRILLSLLLLVQLLPSGCASSGTSQKNSASVDFKIGGVYLGDTPEAGDLEGITRRLDMISGVFNRDQRLQGRFRVSTRVVPFTGPGIAQAEQNIDENSIHLLFQSLSDRMPDVDAAILIFPSSSGRRCHANPSQGYNHEGKIYFCMEAFWNLQDRNLDRSFANLAIHKMFHGFGFNHELLNQKDLTIGLWQTGLPGFIGLPFITGNTAYRHFDLYLNPRVAEWLGRNPDAKTACNRPDPDSKYCKGNGALRLPPRPQAADLDGDGVENRLDLCAWNELRVDGKRVGYGDPIQIPSMHRGELHFSIEAPQVKVIGMKWQPVEVIPGGWLNLGPVGARSSGSTLTIPAERIPARPTDQVHRPLGRLEVEYEYRGVRYVSPRYVEFEDQTLHFVLDKEWLSFNRYGCDAPVRANYGKSWNMNAFNIPNASRPAEYDGDGDGVPDREDTLPAVPGTCKDGKVRGVPDSDGDGVCDLARFKTAVFPFMDTRFILGEPEFYEGGDYCPYTPGSPDRSGC